MKLINLFKKTLTNACVIYTVILTAIYTLGAFVNSSWVPTVQMVYSCLGFSIILSVLNIFLFSDKLVLALRLLIHFVSSSVIFYLLFIVWGGYKSNGGSVLTAFLVYCFAYVLCGAIVGCYRYLKADNGEKNTGDAEYSSIFTSESDKRK